MQHRPNLDGGLQRIARPRILDRNLPIPHRLPAMIQPSPHRRRVVTAIPSPIPVHRARHPRRPRRARRARDTDRRLIVILGNQTRKLKDRQHTDTLAGNLPPPHCPLHRVLKHHTRLLLRIHPHDILRHRRNRQIPLHQQQHPRRRRQSSARCTTRTTRTDHTLPATQQRMQRLHRRPGPRPGP